MEQVYHRPLFPLLHIVSPLSTFAFDRYGFETELNVLEGLAVWSPEYFMQFLATHNFNALRLPFSLEWAARDMEAPLPNQYVVSPDLRGIGQVSEMLRAVRGAQIDHQ